MAEGPLAGREGQEHPQPEHKVVNDAIHQIDDGDALLGLVERVDPPEAPGLDGSENDEGKPGNPEEVLDPVAGLYQVYPIALRKARARIMCPVRFGCTRSAANAIGCSSLSTSSNAA